MSVTGCEVVQSDLMSDYELQEEECNGKEMYKSDNGNYLSYDQVHSWWEIGSGCGMASIVYGMNSLHSVTPFTSSGWRCCNAELELHESYDFDVTCSRELTNWTLTSDFSHVYAAGGAGATPYAPHEDDAWLCEVNAGDGQTEAKSCPAIDLSCVEEGEDLAVLPIPNFVMSTVKERVVGIDFDERSYKAIMVEDDERLTFGEGIVFIDQYTFLVSDGDTIGTVHKYDINGTYLGGFADNLSYIRTLLRIDEQTIAVTHFDGINFFDLEGNNSTSKSTINHYHGATDVSLANDNVLLFVERTFDEVMKICLDKSCPLEKIVDRENTDANVKIVVTIPESDNYLAVHGDTNEIEMCCFNDGECSLWMKGVSYQNFDPYDLMIVDSIVYTMDYSFDKIWASTLRGGFIETVDIAVGDYNSPTQLAFRPGIFAPLSTIITESSDDLAYNAGEQISFPLELRDDRNNAIITPFPDPNRFTVTAVGEVLQVNGEMREITIPQQVVSNENNDFSVAATIISAGNFTLHVKEGTTGIQNSFANSPITLTITHGATEPTETIVDFEDVNENRIFVFKTIDKYGNPTGEENKLRYYFDDDRDGAQPLEPGNKITITTARDFSSEDTLHVLFEGEEINDGIGIVYYGLSPTIFILLLVVVAVASILGHRAWVYQKKH